MFEVEPNPYNNPTPLVGNRELQRLGRLAVRQHLELVLARGPSVRLADVKLGHRRARRRDVLRRFVDHLAVFERPPYGERGGRGSTGAQNRGVERIGWFKDHPRRADVLVGIDGVADLDPGYAKCRLRFRCCGLWLWCGRWNWLRRLFRFLARGEQTERHAQCECAETRSGRNARRTWHHVVSFV